MSNRNRGWERGSAWAEAGPGGSWKQEVSLPRARRAPAQHSGMLCHVPGARPEADSARAEPERQFQSPQAREKSDIAPVGREGTWEGTEVAGQG